MNPHQTPATSDTGRAIKPTVRIQDDPWHLLSLRSIGNMFFAASTGQIVVNLITLIVAVLATRSFQGPSGSLLTTPAVLLAVGSRCLIAGIPFCHRRLLCLESRQAVQCQAKLMREHNEDLALLSLMVRTEPGWSLLPAGRNSDVPSPDIEIALYRDEPNFPFLLAGKEGRLSRMENGIGGDPRESPPSEELSFQIRVQMQRTRVSSAHPFELSGYVRMTAKREGSAIPHEIRWHFQERLDKTSYPPT